MPKRNTSGRTHTNGPSGDPFVGLVGKGLSLVEQAVAALVEATLKWLPKPRKSNKLRWLSWLLWS